MGGLFGIIKNNVISLYKCIALNMLRDSMCYADITKYTGLTLEKIHSYRTGT